MPTEAALNGLTKIGDLTYQQYSRTFTRELSDGLSVTKGVLYTTNTSGQIVEVTQQITGVTARSSPTRTANQVAENTWANFRHGIYQAQDTHTKTTGEPTAQFFGRGSRILHAVSQNVSVGDLVGQNYGNATATSGTYDINPNLVTLTAGSGASDTYLPGGTSIQFTIGTVIEIRNFVRSGSTDLSEQYSATEDGQLAVIEVGGY